MNKKRIISSPPKPNRESLESDLVKSISKTDTIYTQIQSTMASLNKLRDQLASSQEETLRIRKALESLPPPDHYHESD